MVETSGGGATRVLKFGGTSLAEAARVERALSLAADCADGGDPPVVVVSAPAGVTDGLERLAAAAARADGAGGESDAVRRALERIVRRHRRLLDETASREEAEGAGLERLFRELRRSIDRARGHDGRPPPPLRDEILSFGERLCAPIIAAGLRTRGVPAAVRPARGMVVTDDVFGQANVRRGPTDEAVRRELAGRDAAQVVPGFVGATPASRTTTLGRGGSDYTAAVLGAALGAETVEIWTDVSGVMTADPRLVPDARRLPAVGYEAMWALSHFGARVLHPQAVRVAREAELTLRVRDSTKPGDPGTRVQAEPSAPGERAVAVAAAGPIFPGSGSGEVPHARLAVVGVNGRAAELRDRLSAALADEGVELVDTERVAVGSTLTLDVPWRQQTRAVGAVHRALFDGGEPDGTVAGGRT